MFLYSTNVYLKLFIQKNYFHDIHYVWCSEYFDSTKQPGYSTGAHVPASSNPVDIYRELERDIRSGDKHSAKITAQRSSFKTLATQWAIDGKISDSDRDDIIYLADHADLKHWQPVLYIISKDLVAKRLKLVPMHKRAGISAEYIIEDLKGTEFDTINW